MWYRRTTLALLTIGCLTVGHSPAVRAAAPPAQAESPAHEFTETLDVRYANDSDASGWTSLLPRVREARRWSSSFTAGRGCLGTRTSTACIVVWVATWPSTA